MRKIFLIIFIFFLFLISHAVLAGGGRFNIASYNGPGIAGSKKVNIQVWISKSGSPEAAVGEHAEFRVRNLRQGDECHTFNSEANQYGIVFGECSVTQPGQILAYVHSFDQDDDSSDYVLYFNPPLLIPTSTPTSIPIPTFTPQPLPTKISPTPEQNLIPTQENISKAKVELEVEPKGSLNPGNSYMIKIKVYSSNGEKCKRCLVEVKFDESQPLDLISPVNNNTDDNGTAYISVMSFASNDRKINVNVVYPDMKISSSVILPYKNNVLASVFSMINRIVEIGTPLPPMSNVYAKIVKQQYISGTTRILYLKYNAPFGTKHFDIYTYGDNGMLNETFIKRTKEKETSIEVDAFQDFNIDIQACTAEKPSCVNSNPLNVSALDRGKITSQSGELSVPNYGIVGGESSTIDKVLADEQKSIDSNPFTNLFKYVYLLFK